MSELGQGFEHPRRSAGKAMVVYNSNPAAIAPDQNAVHKGLRREDLFTVVLEQFQTDTAISPTSFCPLQRSSNTRSLLCLRPPLPPVARPALPAPGEALPNTEVSAASPLP